MECLILQLKGSVTDNTLPKLNEVSLQMIKTGNGVAVIRITTNQDQQVVLTFIENCGTFYSDSGGTISIGNTVTLANGNNDIYARANSDNGYLSIENFDKVISLGRNGQWNPINEFVGNRASSLNLKVNFNDIVWNTNLNVLNNRYNGPSELDDLDNISDLVNLTTFNSNMPNTGGTTSSFRGIPNLATCALQSPVDLDIDDFLMNRDSSSAVTIYCGSNTKSIKYTGGQNKRFNVVQQIDVNALTAMPTSDIDDLLISISKSSWLGSTKTISVKGQRSSLSDDAVSVLQGMGVTVSFI